MKLYYRNLRSILSHLKMYEYVQKKMCFGRDCVNGRKNIEELLTDIRL